MKTMKIIMVISLVTLGLISSSQNNPLPEVDIYTLDGIRTNTSEINNNGYPMIIVFWTFNDKYAYNQVLMLNDVYVEQLKNKGIKIVAICVDCKGRTDHIKPLVYGQDIEVEVLIDKNGDLRRAMNVPHIPYTILFDHQMQVYCQLSGYCPSSEIVCDKIENCLAKFNEHQLVVNLSGNN